MGTDATARRLANITGPVLGKVQKVEQTCLFIEEVTAVFVQYFSFSGRILFLFREVLECVRKVLLVGLFVFYSQGSPEQLVLGTVFTILCHGVPGVLSKKLVLQILVRHGIL